MSLGSMCGMIAVAKVGIIQDNHDPKILNSSLF